MDPPPVRSASVRFVAWNCQQGLARKTTALARLDPDIAVLSEAPLVSPFQPSLLDEPVSWHSAGPYPAKSVAIAGFGVELAPRSLAEDSHRWGVGATSPGGVGILGIWSVCQAGRRYGDEVLGLVDANAKWIASGRVLVAGDFNIDAHGVGNGGGGAHLFDTLVRRLEGLGLVSAYHCARGESFGAESAMTHFHRRKLDDSFHIDYCFVPAAWRDDIRAVSIGSPGDWLAHSDHMPLVVDLEISFAAVRIASRRP